MRSVLISMILVFGLVSAGVAQQSDEPKKPSKEKKESKTPQSTATKPESKPEVPPAPTVEPTKSEASGSAGSDKDSKEERYDMTEVAPVVSHHQVSVGGKILSYTASAGRLPLKRGDGKTEAMMFFVAYTLDGQDAAKRPLTFAFNGGPGSASIWLHMGALGPKRVVLQPNGFMPAAPYKLEENPDTLLDKSDIVMIDAMSTGFSRAASSDVVKKYIGVRGDIQAFGEFIRMYLSRYERWGSPLFLLGESYGTTRAAGVSGYLADKGIAFNGITLLSMAVDFQTLEWNKSNDLPYVLLLPTYSMIAAYHHKLPAELSQDMAKTREEVERWCASEYTMALGKGDAQTAEERQKTIDQLARYTGLRKDVIEKANLRIDVPTFTQELLRDQKVVVGRLDGRFTGTDPQDSPYYDPTGSAILPPYTSTFNNYVRAELGYKTDMPYRVFVYDDPDFTSKWEWGSAAGGFPSTASELRAAMVKNPYMKVLVMQGFCDLATPFYAADWTIDHLNLDPKFHQSVTYATYDAGHMVYVDRKEHTKMKNDLVQFMQKAQ